MELELINLDNIEYLQSLPDNSVDLIITSPPYNLKNKGGDIKVDSYNDNVPNDVYETKQIEFLNECYRVLKPLGAMFYNHKNRYENNTIITPYSWLLKSQFKIHQEIVWNRKTTVDYNQNKFAPLDEKIFWLFKTKTFSLKRGAQNFTNIWEINRPTTNQNMGHKATFPYELIYRIINCLDMDYSNSILMDPYLGTGTTLQVGKKFNFKKLIGIEIDLNWVLVAEKKINTMYEFDELIPTIKKSWKDK